MSKIANIQVMRAIAALMVVINHCGIELDSIRDKTGQAVFFDYPRWGTGVPLFFVISGFIMVVTCAKAFGEPGAPLDFLRRRLVRIVPLYWLMTTLALGAALLAPNLLHAPHDPGYVLSSYLFWPVARLNGEVRPLATPGWTLNLEMLFYVVFAASLLFSRRTGLAVLALALGGLSLAQAAGILPGTALNFWGDPIIFGFLFGVGVGYAYVQGLRLTTLGAAGLFIAGMALLLHPRLVGVAENNLLLRLADAVPAAMVIAAAALAPQVNAERLGWKVAMLVGDASYSLYLLHEFLLRPFRVVWGHYVGAALPIWTFVLAGVVLSLGVALACYLLFERPVTRWLSGPRKPRAATQPLQAYPAE